MRSHRTLDTGTACPLWTSRHSSMLSSTVSITHCVWSIVGTKRTPYVYVTVLQTCHQHELRRFFDETHRLADNENHPLPPSIGVPRISTAPGFPGYPPVSRLRHWRDGRGIDARVKRAGSSPGASRGSQKPTVEERLGALGTALARATWWGKTAPEMLNRRRRTWKDQYSWPTIAGFSDVPR